MHSKHHSDKYVGSDTRHPESRTENPASWKQESRNKYPESYDQTHFHECIDAHTCGNPVRLVKKKKGGPVPAGRTWVKSGSASAGIRLDTGPGWCLKPRGTWHDERKHPVPVAWPANDVGRSLHWNQRLPPMCGHGTIGTITIGVEEGLIKPKPQE